MPMNVRESLTEFDIISRFFSDINGLDSRSSAHARSAGSSAIMLGVGDDCALLSLPAGQQLALSVDTMVAGRHFPEAAPAFDIARRAVAVAVSDLAAMGARPLAFTLALTLPAVDSAWLQEFSQGLRQAADAYRMPLIGGDTTRGPLTITVQVHGTLPINGGLRRSGGQAGDHVFVTGSLGDAALALQMLQQTIVVDSHQQEYLQQRFYAPSARVNFGEQLLTRATAAIDISDGLLADLGHICKASGLGARIYSERLPLSSVMATLASRSQAMRYALIGGDDYELCFTASAQQRLSLMDCARRLDLAITEIGELVEDEGVVCLDANGQRMVFATTGYQHFS
jgi:thiamine-monophosphate kinase